MIVLASQSPRRAELLEQLGIAFRRAPAAIDERVRPGEGAADFVERIAVAKARAVRASHPGLPVLGADTAVVLDQRVLGKPRDRDDAIAMLRALSGRAHNVLTGVALVTDVTRFALSTSQVRFRRVSDAEAAAYWETGEPADKAGAYAVQGLAAAFIERIEGSYSGIMGLPLFETVNLLKEIGVSGRLGV
ncbi:MAG: nucleoside triphosphate pyrophosphatase [Gammaproteobacteria bacterium]|nr:nucleoside triphosphate pyrophosphatase [Gammaproteobacteria bacterium]